ncbi:hypothetical protein K7432_010278 [Basidiobolus ranarum]|uniref:Uncharacterized protein n=1 Tax=Basidiobolus ranarum TaxID=34480 RepID=A0ABR2VWI6_9FUNG
MKSFFSLVLVALATQVSSAPTGSPSQCQGWSVAAVEHATGNEATFASNDQVVLKWTVSGSQVTNIREVDLYSAKSNEFLHTQYRSYPGVSATSGQLSFTLSVPLCLQRDGSYYLGVYSSSSGQDMNCFLQTPNFQLTADPNGNFTVCS